MKRWTIPLALAAALIGSSAGSAQMGHDQTGGDQALSQPRALAGFFQALSESAEGRRAAPVHILMIGDSHTAADLISGALRDRLQFRFGHGGRGVLPAGEPYIGYAPRLVQTASDGWRTEASFAPTPPPNAKPGTPRIFAAPPPFGLSGYRLTSTRSGAHLSLDAETGGAFDHATVCALSGPGAGTITVTAGEEHARHSLAAVTVAPVCHTLHLASPQRRLELTAEDGPVSLLSWATFHNGGVALSNLGVSGTELRDFAARDDAVLAAELAAYKPDLIILAFGTNDGYKLTVDAPAYQALLEDQLRRLKRLDHDAPVLVLGAPDADTLRPDIYGTGATIPDCSPLSEDEIHDYPRLVNERSPRLARWYPPAGLETLRLAQRRAAVAEGAAFWDWAERMGGPCSADRLSRRDPRLVRGDHVHFTAEGGVMIADLLSADLMRAYADVTGEHR